MNGSSFSAMPCSASSWPTTCTTASLTFPKGADEPAQGRRQRPALADVARSIDFGPHIKLGRGEAAANGRDKPSILSDALEAVIGAVYLDGGTEAATTLVSSLIAERLDIAAGRLDHLDYKSRLQELSSPRGGGTPAYVVRSDGPDHAQHFYASVIVDGRALGEGEGTSKKSAERAAAAAACSDIDAVEASAAG